MRIGCYQIDADDLCWKVSKVNINKKAGEEYLADSVYPGTFPQALRSVLDKMLREELEPDADLTGAVATVARLYATIGRKAEEAHLGG